MTDPAFEAAAWSWVEHLRSGGTTTWRAWRATEHEPVQPRWPLLPTGAQLEVVRLLAAWESSSQGHPDDTFATVADRVSRTPVGGRGLLDPVLPWSPATTAGAPEIEPDELPVGELLRVCVAAIDGWFLDQATARGVPQRPRRRPRRPAFVVAGVSPHAESVRRALLDAGHLEGGHRPTALVVGGPLDAMATMLWRRRVERGAGIRWRRLWAGLAARRVLPAALDLVAVADSWVLQVGADRVHVIVQRDPAAAVRDAGHVLGIASAPARPWTPDVVGTDLLRRLNQSLAIRGPETTRRLLESPLGQAFFQGLHIAENHPLGVPLPQLPWALEQAEALAVRLAAGAFTVHGDPRVVVPSSDPAMPRSVDPRDTLSSALLVLASCERLAQVTARMSRTMREGRS